jgi:hypothetical protein
MFICNLLYYWFSVGEATLSLHHLIAHFTPNQKKKISQNGTQFNHDVTQKRQPQTFQSISINT